ncbi:MAG: DUF1992 domain-containing protein [Paenibacillus sp.]|nr:DUF1992 domain-containing protein [Paenibacillus sp.]
MNALNSVSNHSPEKNISTITGEEKIHLGDNVLKSATKKDIDWENWDLEQVPRSINDMGLLSDEIIRSARARGEFEDLPGRGKPFVQDPLMNNPYIDTTEYYLNKIIQRNGAAPPWVMKQQEVNTDISTFRTQMKSAIQRCISNVRESKSSIDKNELLKRFDFLEKSFFHQEVNRLNKKLKSYNVMCPEPVRKQLLELDDEVKSFLKIQGLN